jgi:succinyl-diaminopimelate desuccinylase
LRKSLTDSGMEVQMVRSNDFPSIIATSRPETAKPKVLLQAHMDVVPAKPELFELKESDGKLYGRGVYDMKFAAACFLQLAEGLKDSLDKYDFGIMFTSDEEIGGVNGVKHMLEQGYGGDVCVLPDGGDDWQLEINCNGVWIIALAASGRTAHGSRPWEGENAIEKLLNILEEIRELFPDNDGSKNTLTISMIEGGKADNQVPDAARVTLDMRLVDKKEFKNLQAVVEKLAVKHKVTLQTLHEIDCIETDIRHELVRAFIEAAEKVRGGKIGTIKSFGSSDARYFNAVGIPTILMRPDGGGAHSDNEWIDKQGFLQYYEVIKEYIQKTAKIS